MPLRKKPPTTAKRKPGTIERNGLVPYLVLYLNHLRTRAFSAHTIETRDASIRRFIVWCDERGLQQPTEITRPIIERYQRHLYAYRKRDGQALSLHAQIQYLQSVRSWFAYLARDNHVPYNVAEAIEPPRRPRRLPRSVLTEKQVTAVLQGPDVETLSGIRDRAILELMYATGLRRGEVFSLRLADIDAERGTVFVNEGKGRKDRYVPVSDSALDWLNKYLLDVRYLLVIPPDDNTVFLTDYGEPFNDHRLTDLVRNYVRSAGINHGACHLFRHAMATHMLEHGADIRFIQAMLGHSKLGTTTIYTHVALKKLKAVYDRSHPAQRKRAQADESDTRDEVDKLFDMLSAEDDE